MSFENEYYPYEIIKLDPKERAEVFKLFSGASCLIDDFVRIGPKGYWLPHGFTDLAPKIYNMAVRPDDIWVTTYPKSGTTLLQELVWLVANNFDYAKAEAIPLVKRFPFIEFAMFLNSEKARTVLERDAKNKAMLKAINEVIDQVSSMQSQRYIKSHLPLSLLPPALLDTCRVMHVARDPRDVVVSYYHHNEFIQSRGYSGNFKQFWNLFIQNRLDWTPYFENVKEAWEKRNHPNMLFLFYEDILQDIPATIKRVAAFLGKTVTDEQLSRLSNHLSFDNFKKNKSVNMDALKDFVFVNKDKSFIRKGKAGGWHDYFDEEMMQQAQQWMEYNLRDTDLRFPTVK
ncbi:unnamed protein product [Chilo suppressalis]|uniref:Sulfotransferase domain-containing protein n=1 Tax=Chilo suppressalis TaxID=168631 RepID=A0ABN8BDD7_CHISP|nr:unnamed protein product [Chilo suppressalis]